MKTMDEFKTLGTKITDGHRSHEEYEGHPRPYNQAFQPQPAPVDQHPEMHEGVHDPERTGHFEHLSHGSGTAAGVAGSSVGGGRGIGSGTVDPTHQHTHGTHGEHGNQSAMGSGLAGAGAGAVAGGLGRDHQRTGYETDLHPHDGRGATGSTGTHLGGTALGGRTEGNTVPGASEHASRDLSSRHHESPVEHANRDLGDRHHESSAEPRDNKNIKFDDNVQHATKQGEDPSLDTKTGKWTGSGEPGSHSAVFGLTPDGKTYDDTQSHTTKLREKNEGRTEGGTDTSSRNTAAPGIADQLNDPRVAEKGHEGKADYGNSSNKPGAGA